MLYPVMLACSADALMVERSPLVITMRSFKIASATGLAPARTGDVDLAGPAMADGSHDGAGGDRPLTLNPRGRLAGDRNTTAKFPGWGSCKVRRQLCNVISHRVLSRRRRPSTPLWNNKHPSRSGGADEAQPVTGGTKQQLHPEMSRCAPGRARRKSTSVSPAVSRGRLVVETRADIVKGGAR